MSKGAAVPSPLGSPAQFICETLSQFGRLSFFLCVKISLNKFCPIAFCQHFYFLFCVKDSLNRKKLVCHPPPITCLTSHRAAWIANIFSLRENFSLFEVFPRYFLSFYYRCIDVYHPFPLPFSFYFFVKTTLILYLTSNFFPCVKITLFSSSCFLIKRIFITVQRYYFVPCFFLFLREKFSPFLAAFFLYMALLRSLLFFFLFAWNFLAIGYAHPCYLLYSNVISLSFLSGFFLSLCENHSLFNLRASSFLT